MMVNAALASRVSKGSPRPFAARRQRRQYVRPVRDGSGRPAYMAEDDDMAELSIIEDESIMDDDVIGGQSDAMVLDEAIASLDIIDDDIDELSIIELDIMLEEQSAGIIELDITELSVIELSIMELDELSWAKPGATAAPRMPTARHAAARVNCTFISTPRGLID